MPAAPAGRLSAGATLLRTPCLEGATLLAYAAGTLLLMAATVSLTGGALAYSLDDPYIHLALAENLWHGHYGLHPSEAASPSSSIGWPYLLAPFSRFAGFELAPLLLGVACSLAALCSLARALREWLGPRLAPGQVALALFLVALVGNFWGLPLTGMEHSAQMLLTTWAVLGLIRLVETGRSGPMLLAGLALGPLVRFENLSLMLMGAVVLAIRGRRASAVGVVLLPLLSMALHLGLLAEQGLPWLPSSVLVKSELASAKSFGAALLELGENVAEGMTRSRIVPFLALFALLWSRLRAGGPAAGAERWRLYLLFACGVAAAHLVAGKHGSQARYDSYLLLVGLLLVVWVSRDAVASLLRRHKRRAAWGLALATLAVGYSQVQATLTTPFAARSVYGANAQMRRFAVEHWRDGVAVNDVGWVSLGNPHYVLDLWGLASEPARRLRRDAADLDWAERLAHERGVDLIMIFEGWFTPLGELPASWEKIALLRAGGRSPGGATTVSFFLADPARRSEAIAALTAFGAALPRGVSLTIAPDERRPTARSGPRPRASSPARDRT